RWMRVTAALLSALSGWVSAQLLARHSSLELRDSKLLEQIEARRGMMLVHGPPPIMDVRLSDGIRPWFANRKSRDWWFRVLLLFTAASLGIALIALTER